MTADRLDDATEARIREACPRHRIDPEASETFALSTYVCYCQVQRAAIQADRKERVDAIDENRVDAFAALTGKWKAERAHADALASMIGVLRDELDAYRSRERECPCCDAPQPANELRCEKCAKAQARRRG